LFVVFVIVALVPDVKDAGLYERFRRSTDLAFWSRLGLSFFLIWPNSQKDIGHVDAALSTSTSSSAVGGVSITAWHGSCYERTLKVICMRCRQVSRHLP
jgi:hypothetical protein